MRTINITGIECESGNEALQMLDAAGYDKAMYIGGRYFAVKEAEARRIESLRVSFAYLGVVTRKDGSEVLCTIPVGN